MYPIEQRLYCTCPSPSRIPSPAKYHSSMSTDLTKVPEHPPLEGGLNTAKFKRLIDADHRSIGHISWSRPFFPSAQPTTNVVRRWNLLYATSNRRAPDR